jgi:hypothetical protein
MTSSNDFFNTITITAGEVDGTDTGEEISPEIIDEVLIVAEEFSHNLEA